jgi:multiple sugar transport system substrate-binding protein
MESKSRTGVSRRAALSAIGLAGAAAIAGPARSFGQAPAIRRKVKLSYWSWADNPGHQKILVAVVEAFNKSQEFVTVTLDAGSRTMELREKLMVAFAAGAAPDVAAIVQTNIQEYFDSGLVAPLDSYFGEWDQKSDFFPNIVSFMHSKPGQPLLYLSCRILPYVLYYRADWFDAAKLAPPKSYDEFIAAARQMTIPGQRSGYAMRGVDYYAVQPIEPIWGSAGVQFVDPKGKVDFASPAAVDVTSKWTGMFTKDHSAQSTAVNDGYPQLFSLMERSRAAMWIYGTHASPQLNAALGDRIQAVPTPSVGVKDCMLANPEGNIITTGCKEKEAAWTFLQYLSSGSAANMLAQGRGYLPVRKTLSTDPAVQSNRFFKIAVENADHWWTPPFASENWASYEDKIPPYWQEALRQQITPQQWNEQAAQFLSGDA